VDDPRQLHAAQQQSAQQIGIFRSTDESDSSVDEDADLAVEETEGLSGSPLPDGLRGKLEGTMGGADLSQVRVHTGEASTRAAEATGSEAFTRGNDIHFGAGQYRPGDAAGEKLIAHEAAHAAKHSGGTGGGAGGGADVSHATDASEQDADKVADALGAGGTAAIPARHDGQAVHHKKKRQPKKEKPLDDWEVGPGPQKGQGNNAPDKFIGNPLTTIEERTELVGERFHQRYRIDNADFAPGGTTFDWVHQLKGVMGTRDEFLHGERNKGPESDPELRPSLPGKKRIATTVVQKPPKALSRSLEVPQVKVNVPSPVMTKKELTSVMPNGKKRPVLDQTDLGEDLVATVTMDKIGADVDSASARVEDGSNLAVKTKSATKLDANTFEVTMKVSKPGKATGQLKVLPLDTPASDVKGLPIDVDVSEKGDDPNAPGQTRPADWKKATEFWKEKVNTMYQRRHDAVSNFFDQEKIEDPPEKPPMWKSLGKMLVKTVLTKVAAYLTAGISEYVGGIIEEIGAEKIKSVLDKGADGVVDAAINAIFDGGAKADTTSWKETAKADLPKTDVTMDIPIAFRDASWQGLAAQKEKAVTFGHQNLEYQAEEMEKKKEGSGFRYVMAMNQALDQQKERAHSQQMLHQLQAWLTMMAGNSKKDGRMLKGDGKGTNLSSLVDKEKVTKHQVGTRMAHDEGGDYDTGEPIYSHVQGVDKIAGVMRVSLDENKRKTTTIGDSKTEYHPFEISGTAVEGIKNKDLRNVLGTVPLRDLKIPMVISFSRNSQSEGFIIGRNESGEMYADEQGDLLSVGVGHRLAGGKVSAVAAAKQLIEKEIGHKHVQPKG